LAENKFNLIDEPWIPVAEKGKVNLRQIFSDTSITSLGGNPVEKISVFKLLLAIAQSACTPETEDDWKKLGCNGMRQKVDSYLTGHYDCFWLYGEKPFLQMPAIAKAEQADKKNNNPYEIGNGTFPDLFPENNTMVTEYDCKTISNDDAAKALFLISLENFSFYGKQVNNKLWLNGEEKGGIAKPGPSLGFSNCLHTFCFGSCISESIFMNLITKAELEDTKIFGTSIGTPFWEKMPVNETCEIAIKSKETLLGHLVPLSRFVLYTDTLIYITEGITYHYSKADKKAGAAGADWIEQSFSWKLDKGEIKYLQADVNKKPWRSITALLMNKAEEEKYSTETLRIFLNRICSQKNLKQFTIWSGGLDVSGDSFGKKIKGNDDYVESEIQIGTSVYTDSNDIRFYTNLTNELQFINKRKDILSECITRYYLRLTGSNPLTASFKVRKSIREIKAMLPEQSYWQLCETKFQQLVTACVEDLSGDKARAMHKIFNSFVMQIYDETCPKDSARQLEAWAENKPFMKKEKEEAEENE